MKTIRIKTSIVNKAAADLGITPEKFVSKMRSLSLGREVCAHLTKTQGAFSVFSCP